MNMVLWRPPQGMREQLIMPLHLLFVPLLRVPIFGRQNFIIRILFVYLYFAKITEKIYNNKFAILIAMT